MFLVVFCVLELLSDRYTHMSIRKMRRGASFETSAETLKHRVVPATYLDIVTASVACALLLAVVAAGHASAAVTQPNERFLGNAPQILFDSENYTSAVSLIMPVSALDAASQSGLLVTVASWLGGDGVSADSAPVHYLFQLRLTRSTPRVSRYVIDHLATPQAGLAPSDPLSVQARSTLYRVQSGPARQVVDAASNARTGDVVICLMNNGSLSAFAPTEWGGPVTPRLRYDSYRWYPTAGAVSSSNAVENLIISSNATSMSRMVPFYAYATESSLYTDTWLNASTTSQLRYITTLLQYAAWGSFYVYTLYGLEAEMADPLKEPLLLGPSTTMTGYCALPTLNAFSISRIAANTSPAFAAEEDCDFFSIMGLLSPAAAQRQCQGDWDCLGFTTHYNREDARETPLCYYRHAADAAHISAFTQPRLWYQKLSQQVGLTSQLNCSFKVSAAGYLSVSARASYYRYKWYMDSRLVFTITPDTSQACGLLTSQSGFYVQAGAVVYVVPEPLPQLYRYCSDTHVSVFATLNPGGYYGSALPDIYQLPSTIAYVRTGVMQSKRRIRLSYSDYSQLVGLPPPAVLTYRFYVVNNLEYALDVAQTSFLVSTPSTSAQQSSTVSPATPTTSSPFSFQTSAPSMFYHDISVSSGGVTSLCGGTYQFFDGQVSGLSYYPSTSYLCSVQTLNSARNTSLAGAGAASEMSLSYQVQSMWFRIYEFQHYDTTLYLRSDNSSFVHGFPLSVNDRLFRTLVNVPSTVLTTTAALNEFFFASLTTVSFFAVVESSVPTTGSTYYFYDEAAGPGENRSEWNPDVTFGCIMDAITLEYGYCVIPVPAGAGKVTIKVEDSNFVRSDNVVSVVMRRMAASGETFVDSTVTCGGRASFKDNAATFGNCRSFRTCVVQTIPTGNITDILIHVPFQVLQDQPCTRAFIATAEFGTVSDGNCTGGFVCRSSQECLAETARVCDGILDCSDRSDEDSCNVWFMIENNHPLSLDLDSIANFTSFNDRVDVVYNGSAELTAYTVDACRVAALVHSADVNVFSLTDSSCHFYLVRPKYAMNFPQSSTVGSSKILTLYHTMFSLSGLTNTSAAGKVFAIINGPSQYTQCDDVVTCSGNGRVRSLYGSCHCVCDNLHKGVNCNELIAVTVDRLTAVYLVFRIDDFQAKMLQYTSYPTPLETWTVSNTVRIYFTLTQQPVCFEPTPLNATHLGIYCRTEGTSDKFDRQKLVASGNTTLTATFASLLRYVDPGVVEIRPASEPRFETVYTTSPANLAELPSPVLLQQLVFQLTLSGYATFDVIVSVVTAKAAGGPSRRSDALSTTIYETVVYNCSANASLYVSFSGFVSCAMDLRGMPPVHNISYYYATRDPFSSVPLYAPAKLFWQRSLDVPEVVDQGPNVQVELTNYSGFLGGALLFLIISFILLVTGLVLRHLHREEMNALCAPPEDESKRALGKLYLHLRTLLLQRNFYMQPRTCLPRDKSAFVLFLVTMNLWIAGMFLGLIWFSGTGLSSNTWVMVDRYASSECASSLTQSLPIAAFYVPDETSLECKRRYLYGTTMAPMYVAAWCSSNGAGEAIAHYRVGASEAECVGSPTVTATAGRCIPSEDTYAADDGSNTSMWSGETDDDTTYTVFSCGTIASVQRRFSRLKEFDSAGLPKESVAVVEPPQRLLQTLINDAAFYTFPSVTGSTFTTVRSYAPFRVETSFPGDVMTTIPTQLITQVPEEAFEAATVLGRDGYAFFHNLTSIIEDASRYDLNSAPNALAAPYAPRSRELPVGKIYNNFNQSGAKAGKAAGIGSTKYYGVRRTFSDIGAYMDIDTATDGDGFTISLYLRATTKTVGFAFAVTDGLVEQSDLSSPLLSLLSDLLATNGGSSSWFDRDFHVYSSLFVDGRAESLSFVHTAPTFVAGERVKTRKGGEDKSKSIEVLTWDLEALQMLQVFNGVWHYVQIIVRLENAQLKAQLVVDGETSLSSVGWNQCFNDDIYPVQKFPANTIVSAYNASSQRFYAGGVLWAGYLNGGVSHLEFTPRIVSMFEIWQSSTPAIRQRNEINRAAYLCLGWVLIAIAAVGFVYMLATSGREMKEEAQKREMANVEMIFLRYIAAIKDMPADPATKELYDPLKYTTAKRWLQLTDNQFGQFLNELKQSTGKVAEEIHRILYLCGDARRKKEPKDISKPLPSAADWNELIEADAESHQHHSSWSFLCFSNAGVEEDPYDVHAFVAGKRQVGPGDSNAQLSATGGESGAAAGAVNLNMLDQMIAQRAAESNHRSDVGNVDASRLKTGGGGASGPTMSSGQSNSAAFQIPTELKQFFLPVITVLQEVYVWMTAGPVSRAYQEYFKNFFSFLSIDVSQAFDQIPPLVTPLVQIFLGLVAMTLLMYYTAMDEYRFSWYVAQYTLKRDSLSDPASLKAVATGKVGKKKRKRAGKSSSRLGKDVSSCDGDSLAASKSQVRPALPGMPHASAVLEEYPTAFGDADPCPVEYRVHVFSVKQSKKIDRFLGVSKLDDDGGLLGGVKKSPRRTDAVVVGGRTDNDDVIHVSDDKGRLYTLSHTSMSRRGKVEERHAALIVEHVDADGNVVKPRVTAAPATEGDNAANDATDEPQKLTLDTLGKCCWHHQQRRLTPQIQTEIWPFACVPSCCVVLNGQRCNVSEGVMYTCGASMKDTDDDGEQEAKAGRECYCDYAVCERHYRVSPLDAVAADLVGMWRTAKQRGLEWVLTTVFIMAANAAYTPFLKTAIMILACHPSFQCVFTKCHDLTDQTYLLAGFLCCVVVLFFGVGLPFAQALQLRRRIHVMREIFFAKDYCGIYDEESLEDVQRRAKSDNDAMRDATSSINVAERHKQLPPMPPQSSDDARCPTDAVVEINRVGDASPASPPRPAADDAAAEITEIGDDYSSDDESGKPMSERVLKVSEWNRFLLSDPTVLGTLYKTLEFDWIYLSPIILLWKVVLLCPAVFLGSGTLEQSIGIAASEVAFGLFMFVTAPFIAPMVDLMYRIGSIHQVAFLGIQALDQVARSDGNLDGLSNILISLTLAYLAFSVGCILWTVVGPQVSKIRDTNSTTVALEELGFQYSLATSLYVVPHPDAFEELRVHVSPVLAVPDELFTRSTKGFDAGLGATVGELVAEPPAQLVVAAGLDSGGPETTELQSM